MRIFAGVLTLVLGAALLVVPASARRRATVITSAPSGVRIVGQGSVRTLARGTATGSAVELVAVPAPGSWFVGWSGDTTALDTLLRVERSRSVVAQFAPAHSLSLEAACCPHCSDRMAHGWLQVPPACAGSLNGMELRCNATTPVEVDTAGAATGRVRIRIPRRALPAVPNASRFAVRITGRIGACEVAAMESVWCEEPTITVPPEGAKLSVGEQIEVQWTLPPDRHPRAVTLRESFDDGQTWRNVAAVPVGGSYPWSVPRVRTRLGRLGLIIAMDSTGTYSLESETVTSGRFSIDSDGGDAFGLSAESGTHGLRLAVGLNPGRAATLTVLDIAGRREHLVRFSAGAARTERVSVPFCCPGVHFVRLEQGDNVCVVKAASIR